MRVLLFVQTGDGRPKCCGATSFDVRRSSAALDELCREFRAAAGRETE